MKTVFRSWSVKDTLQVRKILNDTWHDAYSGFVPAGDLSGYLDHQYNISAIEKSIADPKLVGIIAEVEDVPAGCARILLNTEEERLYVQQLYILPQYQGLGLGSRFMQFAAERAKLLDLDRVWLGVMVKNEPAVIWYKKMGYEITETMPFMMGSTNVDHYIGYVPVDRILSAKDENKACKVTGPLFPRIKISYTAQSPDRLLSKFCFDLLEQQKKTWKQLSEGYTALDSVKTREVSCSNYSVSLQYNHRRIVSTNANTDPGRLGDRKCFLCTENLPEQQKAILYRDEYLILCNPVPIFSQHYTVSNTRHIPQELKNSFDILVDLSKDLSPDFTVFYNGPRCGASAPDHMHFQVSPWRAIPVENDAVDMKRRKKFYYKNHVAAFELTDYGRVVLVVESTNRDELIDYLKMLCTKWKKISDIPDEPKMNIICSYQQDMWRVIVFPRSKHRPEVFFREGSSRIMVSPAAVDMGGLIITPVEKDFLHIDSRMIESIFAEVSEKPDIAARIIEAVK